MPFDKTQNFSNSTGDVRAYGWFEDRDFIVGGNFNDTLLGDRGSDEIFGGKGNDLIADANSGGILPFNVDYYLEAVALSTLPIRRPFSTL